MRRWRSYRAPEVVVSSVSGMRAVVLVIGDQPLLRMQAVDLVEDAGFEVIEASRVDEAVRILEGAATSYWSSLTST